MTPDPSLAALSDRFFAISVGLYSLAVVAFCAQFAFGWREAPQLVAAAGRPVDIIQVGGSVEVAPLLSLSHWIVDLVDTGNTLRANGLVERETILHCGAVLVANRASQKLKLEAYLDLMQRLEQAAGPLPTP